MLRPRLGRSRTLLGGGETPDDRLQLHPLRETPRRGMPAARAPPASHRGRASCSNGRPRDVGRAVPDMRRSQAEALRGVQPLLGYAGEKSGGRGRGRGWEAMSALERCVPCKGRGWVPGDCHPREVCGACDGTGFIACCRKATSVQSPSCGCYVWHCPEHGIDGAASPHGEAT